MSAPVELLVGADDRNCVQDAGGAGMTWFLEGLRSGALGWERIGGPYSAPSKAREACPRFRDRDTRDWWFAQFRVVREDERTTVEQRTVMPHGWRLRWRDDGREAQS